MSPEGIMRVEDSIGIDAPIERVWDIATNPMLSPRWNSNVIEVRNFSGFPVGVGTTWVQMVRIAGRNTPMSARVIEYDPPHRGTVQLTGPGNPRVNTYLTQEDGRTVIRQVMEITMGGGFGGVALRLARPTIQRELKQALVAQKQASERGLDN